MASKRRRRPNAKPQLGLGTLMMVLGISTAAWGVIHRNDPLTPVTPKWGGPSQAYIERSWPIAAIIAGVGCAYIGWTLFLGDQPRR